MKLNAYRKIGVVLAIASVAWIFPASADITGAGSTFVYPLLAKWAADYKTKTGVSVNYQSIGSGGGIKQIQAKTVDFGATDMPLKPEELAKDNLLQFPVVSGAIVAVFHVPGIESSKFRLTGPALADIFLGKIKKWNDAALTSLNPGVKLPDREITVVHRSDGSGTSFILTNYLSKISPEWKAKVGEGVAVSWPTGVGGKGNEGVASFVKQIEGSIGYVEFAYAVQNKMAYSLIKNHDGHFVEANDESFSATARSAAWDKAPGYYMIMTDAGGKRSWPITGSTFVLLSKAPKDSQQTLATLKFFKWAFANGETGAKELHYVPIPTTVAKSIESKWEGQIQGVSIDNSL